MANHGKELGLVDIGNNKTPLVRYPTDWYELVLWKGKLRLEIRNCLSSPSIGQQECKIFRNEVGVKLWLNHLRLK